MELQRKSDFPVVQDTGTFLTALLYHGDRRVLTAQENISTNAPLRGRGVWGAFSSPILGRINYQTKPWTGSGLVALSTVFIKSSSFGI
jgi:hypothetical protein